MIVRKGTKEDVPSVLKLIKELAIYERAEDEVENTEKQLLEDGFGNHPSYGLIVAEIDNQIVGISVYYIRYSTWKGRCLFLEDLIVTEKFRGKGVGMALFKETARESLTLKTNLMAWQVLDWNEPAINFYKKLGADLDAEWINARLYRTTIEHWLNEPQN